MADAKRNQSSGTSTRKSRKTNDRSKSSPASRKKTPPDKDKFVLCLNDALAFENAVAERLQIRVSQTKLPTSKVRLQQHQDETKKQQMRLESLISSLGGKPTKEKAKLPELAPPESIRNLSKKYLSDDHEIELQQIKKDVIMKTGELVLYDLLLRLADKIHLKEAVHTLTQNLNEELSFISWMRSNTPIIGAQLASDLKIPVRATLEALIRQKKLVE